jgi:alanyl-tRNA synthetase
MAGTAKVVLSGTEIFKLMDSHGLPLDLINDMLRDNNMGFNVLEFVQAAYKSKNFKRDRILRVLLRDLPEPIDKDLFDLIHLTVRGVYGEDDTKA